MAEPQPEHEPARQPLNSLATKIILFVFVTACVTALGVSWISIQATHAHLTQSMAQRYPAALERAAERIESAGSLDPESEAGRAQLEAWMARERPDTDTHMLLVDARGRSLVASPPPGAEPLAGVPPHLLRPAEDSAPRSYTNVDGLRSVGGARRLAESGRWLVAEIPFERAYAPVLSVVTRVFVADLCIILLFSFLAYRITAAVVRPVEVLSDAARRIAQGQFDHEVPEPRRLDEIGLLARTFNDMMRRLRGYQSEIESANEILTERNAELQQAKETFEQLSITDGLTKLHNHRFFHDHLTREIKRVTRTEQPLAMLMVDIDDFKSLNDRLGHAAGDELLLGLARIMSDTVRESDLLARYGGEEFVVLASDTELEGAYLLAEKIRTNVAETSFILDDSLRPTRITVSIGVALFKGNRKTFFQAADRALYRAKAQGKNCVVLDEEEGVA